MSPHTTTHSPAVSLPPLLSQRAIRRCLSATLPLRQRRALLHKHRRQWIAKALSHVSYEQLTRRDRGLVRRYLQRFTGYSRAQVQRHVALYMAKFTVVLFLKNAPA
jgi:hypothetical protein